MASVRKTTLKVAETHRAVKIVKERLYSRIRHPQYFGGILTHIRISFLLSSLFSLIATPIIMVLNFLISWKEEKELLNEFGNEYKEYKKKVPMFIPKLRG
ncbi:MAG: methyltransferase family protein [Candidatus Thorarchaeota archaeon]